GSEPTNQVPQLSLEVVDLCGQLLAAQQVSPGKPGHNAVEAFKFRQQLTYDVLAPQAAAGDHQIRVQLVEVPANLLSDAGPLNHQVMTVIRQKLDLTRRSVQLGDGKVGVT